MLKTRIAFLSRLVVLAMVIEAGNGRPCAISDDLAGLGVEKGRKGVFLRQLSTEALQIIGGNTACIHPLAQALVPDELRDPDRFIDGCRLLARPSDFVLVDQHAACLSSLPVPTVYSTPTK